MAVIRALSDTWLGYRLASVLCRVFHHHTLACRGRGDHVRDGKIIDPGRWHTWL